MEKRERGRANAGGSTGGGASSGDWPEEKVQKGRTPWTSKKKVQK